MLYFRTGLWFQFLKYWFPAPMSVMCVMGVTLSCSVHSGIQCSHRNHFTSSSFHCWSFTPDPNWVLVFSVLCCTSSRRRLQIPALQPVSSTRDLGIYIDADMTMRNHVTAIVRVCFSALHQIWSVRRSLSRHALLTLVCALIVSKVDYCNSVLARIPGQWQDRLQSVLNAAARLVYSARRSERITPLLRELHWFRVPERVTFRLCVLAYRCLPEQRRRTLLGACI